MLFDFPVKKHAKHWYNFIIFKHVFYFGWRDQVEIINKIIYKSLI